MKAIVLSYDKNHYLVDNMITSYNRTWPSHPFVFRIPYQENKSYLQDKFGSQVEMVKSPPEIVKTILHLVHDLPKDEWVYWCIDDKYPIQLNEDLANKYLNWVLQTDDPKLRGLVYHRAWALWNDNVDKEETFETNFSTTLLRRKSWRNFWLHQFYRAGVIQDVVGTFEGEPKRAKQMDNWVKFDIPHEDKLWVARKSIALFGESSSRGLLMKNAARSLRTYGIEIPVDVAQSRQSMYMGTRLAHLHMRVSKFVIKARKSQS